MHSLCQLIHSMIVHLLVGDIIHIAEWQVLEGYLGEETTTTKEQKKKGTYLKVKQVWSKSGQKLDIKWKQ